MAEARVYKIGLVQMTMGPGVEANFNRALEQVRAAARQGAQVICLPELFRAQYFCQREELALFDLAEAIPGRSTERLGALAQELGVVIVVGGPQYRAGSGRQYVLLARRLAAVGFPALRFDVRGMGDSTGEPRGFQALDADIRAALDCFFAHAPGLRRVVLWGLCDAAAAVLFYAHQDSRVQGLVLLNPWVYSQQGAAKTRLKHYYRQRLCSPDLWRKLLSFRFDFADSWQSWLGFLKQATAKTARDAVAVEPPLADRLRACLARFQQPVLLILSGRDLTASEFKDVVQADAGWRGLLNRPDVTRLELAAADHTFSSALWRDQVAAWTVGWLKALG